MFRSSMILLVSSFMFSQGLFADEGDDAVAKAPVVASSEAMAESAWPTPFDPATWGDRAGKVTPGQTMAFNPADPGFWQQFVNPETHTKMHMTFTNPAQYEQMMSPAFFTQMMNPAVWAKWMQPQTYQQIMTPETVMYWMQPGAYMHGMNPQGYSQMMNLQAFSKYVNPAFVMTAASGTSADQGSMFNWFYNTTE